MRAQVWGLVRDLPAAASPPSLRKKKFVVAVRRPRQSGAYAPARDLHIGPHLRPAGVLHWRFRPPLTTPPRFGESRMRGHVGRVSVHRLGRSLLGRIWARAAKRTAGDGRGNRREAGLQPLAAVCLRGDRLLSSGRVDSRRALAGQGGKRALVERRRDLELYRRRGRRGRCARASSWRSRITAIRFMSCRWCSAECRS